MKKAIDKLDFLWNKDYVHIEENLNHRTIKISDFPSITKLSFSPLKIPGIKVDQKLFWKLNLKVFGTCVFDYHLEPQLMSPDVLKSAVIGA